ncbi:MAG: 3-oxoacyl-ACP reductase family protein [Phycisphaerae bacterium]|nr:3-oxoacyl-ACP reductase family protein [Tepidisphaeraceae bacterium]
MAAGFSLDLSGKVALVTGSSRGIGAAIARALAAHGARVAVNYVADADGQNRADAEAVVAEIAGGAFSVDADVSDPAAVGRMFEQVVATTGGLDILINNAGIIRDRSLKKITLAEWDAVIAVNLSGAFHCLREAASRLRPGGRVINLASVAAVLGLFGQANYAASKAGLIALTKVAARELAGTRVTVNAIAPGFVDTDMVRTTPAALLAKFVEQVPLKRLGAVEDVAGVALFLCSPMAGYVTGQTIHVNGGFFME